MQIKIKGWNATGLRGSLEDIEIDISDDLRPWTIIQMPNGTGKTTTMKLFRLALSGAELAEDEIQDFRAESMPDSGEFKLRLEVNGMPVTLGIAFDFLANTIEWWTLLVPGGRKSGRLLPDPYNRILSEDLTRLFVFDGELARQLRDRKLTKAEDAIGVLYRLSIFKTLAAQGDLVLSEKQRAGRHTKASEPAGISRLTSKRDEALTVLNALRSSRSAKELEQEKLSNDLEDLRAEIRRLVDATQALDNELKKAEADRSKAAQDIELNHVSLAKEFIAPQRLNATLTVRLKDCWQSLDAAKLPGRFSSEFFHWLSKQSECVCGKTIHDTERPDILNRSQEYLGDEQYGVIGQIKDALRRGGAASPLDSNLVPNLDDAVSRWRFHSEKVQELENEKIKAAGGDVDSLREEESDLVAKVAQVEEALTKLSAVSDGSLGQSWKNNIPLCEQELEACEKALQEGTETSQLAARVKTFKNILESIESSLVRRIREKIRQRTNHQLEAVIIAEDLIVSKIDSALELSGPSSRIRSDVSEGQSLGVAYAFLTALFAEASYRLPFVVDSPAVPLDIETRREVSSLLPNIFEQMIMFVISSEREGFAETFYDRKDVKYLTIWQSQSSVEIEEGLAFFKTFQSTDEGKIISMGDRA